MKKFFLYLVVACLATLQLQASDVSRYPVPSVEEMPKDLQKMMANAKKQLGFVPNVLKALAHRPAELRAFMSYHHALMHKKSGLTRAEKEMLIVAHSSVNGCMYCVVSHGSNLRLASKKPTIADQVAVNYLEADISPRERAILDFAVKITENSKAINEEDFKTLKSHGLSDDDIWDVAGIAAFFNMSNRLMNFLAVKPNDEYFTRGR